MLLVVGSDGALLEGLAQALTSAGHRVVTCRSLDDAAEPARQEAPVLLIVDRRLVTADEPRLALAGIPIASGGAIVTFHSAADGSADVALTPSVGRLQLADLELPLERARLVALAAHVTQRSRKAGRHRSSAPPEFPRA